MTDQIAPGYRSFIKGLIFLVTIGIVLLGCELPLGSSGSVGHSVRGFLIPDIQYLGEPTARTDSATIATVPLDTADPNSNFHLRLTSRPAFETLVNPTELDGITPLTKERYETWWSLYETQIVKLIDGGTIEDTVLVLFASPSGYGFDYLFAYSMINPLKTQPVFLQFSYAYEPVDDATKTVISGIAWEENFTTTEGATVAQSESFTSTLGVSASATVGGSYGPISAELSVEVSSEFSSSQTYAMENIEEHESSETYTWERTEIYGDATVLCMEWQRIELFEFVDENGATWDVSDLGYVFDYGTGIFGLESRTGSLEFTADWFF